MAVFIAGRPLNPKEHRDIIVQRPELDRILAHMQSGDLYVALCSPPQTGKTTLLYQIRDRLHGRGYGVVYLDLGGLSDLSKAEFYQRMCTSIHKGLGELIDVTSQPVMNLEHVTDQIAFSSYLTWLAAYTPQARKLILILDELAGVSEATSLILFPSLRSFFQNGRNALSEGDLCRKIFFIFAGALDIQRLMQGRNSPLWNVCERFSLDGFSQEQVRNLARNLEDFSPEQVVAIADAVHWWCNGHPSLTQRLFAFIEASVECRRASLNQLPRVVEQLVEMHFLYGDDANLQHILHSLKQNQE